MSDEMPPLSPLFYNESYNPLKSILTFTSIYGEGTEITFRDLEELVNTNVTQATIFGTRIGAAGLALIIMWMISKNRKTPIFLINQSSLVLTVIQSSLYLAVLLNNYGGVAFALTFFPQLPSRHDVYVYGAATMIQCLLVACIEISLVFQVRVLFKADNHRKLCWLAAGVSTALGTATFTMWMVTGVKMIVEAYKNPLSSADPVYFNNSIILLACSINFMTLLLSIKLFMAIRARRFLGLKQFDSFHILLIMSTQTLIGPSILYILAYSLPGKGTESLTSIATLLVVLSLPLTSMWAAAANDGPNTNTFNPQFSPYSKYSDGSSHLSYGRTMSDKYSFASSPQKSDVYSSKENELSTQVDLDLESNISFDNNTDVNANGIVPRGGLPTLSENLVHPGICSPDSTADDETRAFWSNTVQGLKDDGLMQSKTVFKDLR